MYDSPSAAALYKVSESGWKEREKGGWANCSAGPIARLGHHNAGAVTSLRAGLKIILVFTLVILRNVDANGPAEFVNIF